MMETVWARDPAEGFILSKISELLNDGAEVTPLDAKYNKKICSFEDIFQTGEYHKEFDDNCIILNNFCFFLIIHYISFR